MRRTVSNYTILERFACFRPYCFLDGQILGIAPGRVVGYIDVAHYPRERAVQGDRLRTQ